MKHRIYIVIALVCVCLLLLSGCNKSGANTSTPPPSGSATGVLDGKAILEARCVSCHSLAQVYSGQGTASQWTAVVDNMITRGAVLSADEKTILVQYLADNMK
jgi:hypothetical protein